MGWGLNPFGWAGSPNGHDPVMAGALVALTDKTVDYPAEGSAIKKGLSH